MANTIIAIVGPTAVGKTATAIEVAKAFSAEILSFDSRQFFAELNIGTAKPSKQELTAVKHHFIGQLSIKEEYNASKFEKEALSFLKNYFKSHDQIVFCGGSGMYLDAISKGFDSHLPSADQKIRENLNQLMQEKGIIALQDRLKRLDPAFYEVVDKNNSKRLLRALEVCLLSGKPYSELRKGKHKKRNFQLLKIGLKSDRELLYEKINRRVDQMMQKGLLEEARKLIDYRSKNALKTVGYKELFAHFDGKYSLEEAVDKIKINSRRYAKRQITWFKKDNDIKWFESGQNTRIIEYIRNSLIKQ